MVDGWDDDSREPFRLVPKETAGRISESLKDYYPGRWAEEANRGPACKCGHNVEYLENNKVFTKHGKPMLICPRHNKPITRRRE